jgi:hypothetical protein
MAGFYDLGPKTKTKFLMSELFVYFLQAAS